MLVTPDRSKTESSSRSSSDISGEVEDQASDEVVKRPPDCLRALFLRRPIRAEVKTTGSSPLSCVAPLVFSVVLPQQHSLFS
mmetsp:Transcript_14499/g.35116  ORF Transcript_14499/g.35116 Transcript_14499/m.35116 type:complete len:82 (-) Transcript_14499:433-678(-)